MIKSKQSNPIFKGMKIPAMTKPVIGKRRGNQVIGVCNAVAAAKIVRGGSDAVFVSSDVLVFQIKKTADSGDTTSTGLTRYRIKELFDDYVRCRTWDGSSEGAEDILVAKQANARLSVTTDTFQGSSWTATYSSSNQRTLTNSPRSVVQYLHPIYAVNGDIWGIGVDGGTGVGSAPDIIEASIARHWNNDLILSASGGWRGVYNSGTTYNAGAIVSTSEGIWGCNTDGTVGVAPGGGHAEWDFICYPPASMSVCTGGDEATVAYNGLPPS